MPSEAAPQTRRELRRRRSSASHSVGFAPLRGADISKGQTRKLASFAAMLAFGDA
jgi:hypothetical protein